MPLHGALHEVPLGRIERGGGGCCASLVALCWGSAVQALRHYLRRQQVCIPNTLVDDHSTIGCMWTKLLWAFNLLVGRDLS